MTTQEDRGPLSTEISIPETEIDPQASGRCDSRTHDPNRSEAEATTDERLSIGERLSGRYRIERELGEGGMGVVYLVSDQEVVGETFAVKVLKEALDPQALQLLREEVRRTRKLSHPNVVDMHSVNVDGKRLYVLMEYLEGKTLNTLLEEEFGRGMSFSHAWPIIEDVGAALGYAHDHNVIHSDLKPANVLLTTSGKTKLLDFGIARVSRGPLLHKRSGQRALTPAYASYEMLKGEEADRRDDIYSFACVLYEMLSGQRPLGELTAVEARDAGAHVEPLRVLSQRQNAALAKALALKRQGRTGSVEELIAGLRAEQKPLGRRLAVLLTVSLVAVMALGATYLIREKPKPSDNDLRTAYCIPLVKQRIAQVQQTLSHLAPETAQTPELKQSLTAAAEQLRGTLARDQANLSRLQAYLQPKMTTLDPVAIAGATHRAKEDWRTIVVALDRCEDKCGPMRGKEHALCFSSCPDAALNARVKSCADPNWLPF
jgi:serine/threonine protein kinase